MVMETIDKVISNLGAADIDARLEELLVDGILYAFQEQVRGAGHLSWCSAVSHRACNGLCVFVAAAYKGMRGVWVNGGKWPAARLPGSAQYSSGHCVLWTLTLPAMRKHSLPAVDTTGVCALWLRRSVTMPT